METTKTRQPLQPWARALIIGVILLFLALVFVTAGAGPAAALFGFFGAGVIVIGVVLALSNAGRSDA